MAKEELENENVEMKKKIYKTTWHYIIYNIILGSVTAEKQARK